MAYGVKKLRKIQFAREATAGTALAATDIWRGPANMPEDLREITFVDEDVGQLTPTDRSFIGRLMAQMVFESTPLTFTQALHVLEAGINAETAVADGTGSGYVWTYTIGDTTNDPKTYTLEGGDNVDVGEMEYSFVREFVISGEVGGAVMLESATWEGRQYTDTSFTAALTLDSLEEVLFSKMKLYIDADGGSFGATQKSGTLLGFRLTVDTGWRAVPVGDGNLYFATIKNVGPTATLELTLEHDATAAAERANWRSETVRKVRLIAEGSALGTPDTYTYLTWIIDIRGKWESYPILEDQDGDNVVTPTLRLSDDSSTPESKIVVVNEESSL